MAKTTASLNQMDGGREVNCVRMFGTPCSLRSRSPGSVWEPDPKAIGALYRRASILESKWPQTSVAQTPGRMVDAVVRQILRMLEEGRITRIEARDPARLVAILDWIWTRNAKRDYARSRSRQTYPLIEDVADRSNCFERIHDEQLLSRAFRALVASGYRKEFALAFLLSSQGSGSSEISAFISRACGRSYKPCAIRQWKRRVFPQMSALLKASPDLFSTEVRSHE